MFPHFLAAAVRLKMCPEVGGLLYPILPQTARKNSGLLKELVCCADGGGIQIAHSGKITVS